MENIIVSRPEIERGIEESKKFITRISPDRNSCDSSSLSHSLEQCIGPYIAVRDRFEEKNLESKSENIFKGLGDRCRAFNCKCFFLQ